MSTFRSDEKGSMYDLKYKTQISYVALDYFRAFRYFRSLLFLSCRSGEPTWGDTHPEAAGLAGPRGRSYLVVLPPLAKLGT